MVWLICLDNLLLLFIFFLPYSNLTASRLAPGEVLFLTSHLEDLPPVHCPVRPPVWGSLLQLYSGTPPLLPKGLWFPPWIPDQVEWQKSSKLLLTHTHTKAQAHILSEPQQWKEGKWVHFSPDSPPQTSFLQLSWILRRTHTHTHISQREHLRSRTMGIHNINTSYPSCRVWCFIQLSFPELQSPTFFYIWAIFGFKTILFNRPN